MAKENAAKDLSGVGDEKEKMTVDQTGQKERVVRSEDERQERAGGTDGETMDESNGDVTKEVHL